MVSVVRCKIAPEPFGTFTIYFAGKPYNGHKMLGKAFIECQPSKNETERLSLRPSNGWSISTDERPGFLQVETIPPQLDTRKPIRHESGSPLHFPSTLFSVCIKRLWAGVLLNFTPHVHWEKGGFSFGPDPDGRDVEWQVSENDRALLDWLRLAIKARSEDALESEPTQVPQESPLPAPAAVDHSTLVSAVNRLFWAVVIIGLLLVIKAL